MTRPLRALLAVAVLLFAAAPVRAEGGLNIVPDPARLGVLLALFLLLIPVLNGLVFRPLLAVLDEREKRIAGAYARASEVSSEAAVLVERHEAALREVREASNVERARAVEEARRAHQAAVGEARRAAEREIAGARGEVATAVESARAQLRIEAEPLAREVAERLLGRRFA
jgi:F-type H+-transporting ATPase subunit b